MFTTVATWSLVLAALIFGGWALFAEHFKKYDEPMVQPVCTDHEFYPHPEDETCNYWYTGVNGQQWSEPCPYTMEQHETQEWYDYEGEAL